MAYTIEDEWGWGLGEENRDEKQKSHLGAFLQC